VQLSDLVFALIGVGALLAGVPGVLERRPLSLPIAFLALGMVVFAMPVTIAGGGTARLVVGRAGTGRGAAARHRTNTIC
jgi:hypothetical protein